MRKSENNRYFFVVGNATFCTPDTVRGKVIELDYIPDDEYVEEIFFDQCADITESVTNHPEDNIVHTVFPEVIQTENGKLTCTLESAIEATTAYRDYVVINHNAYKAN